jgi:hypothetical protein
MKNSTREIVRVSLFISLAIVVPLVFHFLGLGSLLLPMFLPILLAGFFLKPVQAMIVGFFSPWLSTFLTGMPPLLPTAPLMSLEGIVMAGIVSLLYHRHRRSIWLSLILALLAERLVLVLAIYLIIPLFNLPPGLITIAALTQTLPGIAVQLILVPLLVLLVQRAWQQH